MKLSGRTSKQAREVGLGRQEKPTFSYEHDLLIIHIVVSIVVSLSALPSGPTQPRKERSERLLRRREPVRPPLDRILHLRLHDPRALHAPPEHLLEPPDADARLEVHERDFAAPGQDRDRQGGEALLFGLNEVEQRRRAAAERGGRVVGVRVCDGRGDELERWDLGRPRGREGRVGGEGEGADIVGEREAGRDQGERSGVDARLQDGCCGSRRRGRRRDVEGQSSGEECISRGALIKECVDICAGGSVVK